MSKKQLTFSVSEKPNFENTVELLETVKFIKKLEDTVKLFNRHSKSLKEYLVNKGVSSLDIGEYQIRIEEGTTKYLLNTAVLQEFLKTLDKTVEEFKTLPSTPKSLKIFRD